MSTPLARPAITSIDPEAAYSFEVRKSWLLRAWILSGLLFMALPGTLLGFTNLVAIAASHNLSALPAAWMEGHGHAQVFGWIGSFILGIGFYSQPARGRKPLLLPCACLLFWTSGVWLRWAANIYEWRWQALLPLSSGLELAAALLFVYASSQHKRKASSSGGVESWIFPVLMGTVGVTAAVVFNFVECLRLAASGATPAFPHGLDQRYLILLGWGFLAPVVWGFSARWLPSFLRLVRPRSKALLAALGFDLLGVILGLCGWLLPASAALVAAALLIVLALNLALPAQGPFKAPNAHSSLPVFVRLAYGWLVVAAAMSLWVSLADRHSGVWGASRHALTVGFLATMVYAIGPLILPHFCGIKRILSTRLSFVSLALLQTGCLLRVGSEPLAYEYSVAVAWRILPLSATLELSGVLLFAANLAITILFGQSTFRRGQERTASL